MSPWAEYQERVAHHFRSIGLEAETNATLNGARTSHEIDVVVRTSHVGFDLLWLVECKRWRQRVSKLHVLALREIVSDIGADRGILMAESGHQRGAFEAAHLTNVQLTSLEEVVTTSSEALGRAELREIQERTDRCNERYWNISKSDRIDLGLRPPVPALGYSGAMVIRAVEHTISTALRGRFSIAFNEVYSALESFGGRSEPGQRAGSFVASTPHELAEHLDAVIGDLERRLDRAETALNELHSDST